MEIVKPEFNFKCNLFVLIEQNNLIVWVDKK